MDITCETRFELVSLLATAHSQLCSYHVTLNRSINLLDRFLARHHVAPESLPLLSLSCLWIAAKYEEPTPPSTIALAKFLTGSKYDKRHFCAMESVLLNALEFRLNVPLAIDFLRLFWQFANVALPTAFITLYFLELALMDVRMLMYNPSAIAAGALYLARHVNRVRGEVWSFKMERYTQYDNFAILVVARDLLRVVKDALTLSNRHPIVQKYLQKNFGRVARRPLPSCL